jgi:hypothetical protein
VQINRILPIALLFALACSQSPVLSGFNSDKWQADADGCNGQRTALVVEVINRKSELAGLGQNDIRAVLGKPNRHELYSRNKKAFVYFVKGGPNCEQRKEKPDRLVIRFDGIGRAKEFILYKE